MFSAPRLMRNTLLAAIMAAAGCAGSGAESAQAADTQNDSADFVVETSAPEPGSSRALALAALDLAEEIELYSLQPYVPPPPPFPGQPDGNDYDVKLNASTESYDNHCRQGGCLYGNKILGKVDVVGRRDQDALREILRLSLDRVPNYGLACAAQYRHAIGFKSDGDEYHVMMCYECGQIAIAMNGNAGYQEQAYEMDGEPELDAILKQAGVPLAPKQD